MDDYLAFAHRLADEVRPIVARYFRTPIAIESKNDASPVTQADRAAEHCVRALINAQFPHHGIIGEEYGTTNPYAEFCWVIDPIDGTRAFITGKPTFTTLIALLYRGEPVLGVIDQPILQERWVGAKGLPTQFNGQIIYTRRDTALKEAYLTATSPHMFSLPELAAFEALRADCHQAIYGSDAYGYACLASGLIDLVVEADMKPHDFMALIPVIEGAGGVVTDWKGETLTLQSRGRIVAAAHHVLHTEALMYLKDVE